MSANSKLLEGYLKSRKIKKASELVLSNEEALTLLLSFLHSKDSKMKLAAVMTLEEALKRMPDIMRLRILKRTLDDLIALALENDDRVSIYALRAIKALITGLPLDPESFVKLGHAIKDLVKARRNEVVLLEIPPILESVRITSSDPRVHDIISRLLHSKNPRLKAMGLRLLLNTSAYTGDPALLKTVFSEVRDMLTVEDIPLIDFALTLLLDVAHYPLREEIIDDVAGVLTLVKNLALKGKPGVSDKARLVAEKLEDAIYRYYKNRPEEAKQKIQELLINERFYEAIDLALAVGDTYVLNWLAEELEKMEKERLRINERVLPGPKYLSPPPEAKAQKSLKVPHISQFGRKKTGREKLTKHVEKSGQTPKMSDEETKKELEKAITSGKTSELIELAMKKPEVIFELERKLEEGDKFEKMDALWALSKLAEKLDETKAFILKPAVEPLMKVASSKNRWMRLRAVRTLAAIAPKAPYGDEIVGQFLEWYLSGDEERVVPSLEFFSYYFSKIWDEKTARVVLSRLLEYLENDGMRFDALLTLDALVGSAPVEKVSLFGPFVEKLKEIKKTASPDEQKLAIRILENIASKSKALVIH
ncbi:hypothetical protein, conserved [Thermococcus kodakarensis KOD1]|uniref:Uncharacterized protein n=1 Tax=Thermococcus kodakarensis (strain ATCC BAA-918 / JCM 12380 / KOD1) TaxID=69014 RepID=Q5JET6_THEKO|nr:hypothetical protein [Thermococcus kodakarensis]WCN27819.1 hypothetical protein POG15_09820 [Thermococcus kodakarensis]WCN30117.1 hypothetical protein POG21_09805 [Thermococcus kodakarensis]BAD86118.1 hypothetical protein, conserved [Thermococcus kodakarensis KOD1]